MRFRIALAVFCGVLSGCRAHVVEIDIVNHQNAPIRNLEVTFGGGSYGRSSIAPGTTNHNRIKIFGLAPIEVQFDEATGKHVTTIGPRLSRNAEGTITLDIEANGTKWAGTASPR